jgi:hypothetical protein
VNARANDGAKVNPTPRAAMAAEAASQRPFSLVSRLRLATEMSVFIAQANVLLLKLRV